MITVYQPRLILIRFLNPCVIKTAQREQHWEKGRGGGDISQTLRPSVRVTRKVILRFKRTDLKLVRALTLQGKTHLFLFISRILKNGITFSAGQGATEETSLWGQPQGVRRKRLFRSVSDGAEKTLTYETCPLSSVAGLSHESTVFQNWPRGADAGPWVFSWLAPATSAHFSQRIARVSWLLDKTSKKNCFYPVLKSINGDSLFSVETSGGAHTHKNNLLFIFRLLTCSLLGWNRVGVGVGVGALRKEGGGKYMLPPNEEEEKQQIQQMTQASCYKPFNPFIS